MSPTAGRSRLAIGLVALVTSVSLVVLAINRPRAQTKSVQSVVAVPHGATSIDPQSGRQWRAVAGTWVIYDGRLALDRADPRTNMLVTHAGSNNYTVIADTVVVGEGIGLLFRYSDPSNYWAITEVPGVATWSIVRVIDGAATQVASTGPETCCGRHVAVSTGGDGSVAIILNGLLQLTFVDLALVGARGTGVIATGSEARNAVVADLEVRKRSLQ
jgi:hypothetical protein